MRRQHEIARVVLAVAATAFVVAGAASATLVAGPSDPVVEVQFLVDGEDGSGFLLVGGTLPKTVELPATLNLPAPEGAQVWWAGELMGGGSTSDISREATVVPGEGGSAVAFTLETTSTGQYDALYLPTEIVDGERRAVLEWVQSAPASKLVFSVVFPAGAQDVRISPTPASGPLTNRLGETLYVLPSIDAPEPGSIHVVEASYRTGIQGGADRSRGPGGVIAVLGVTALFLGAVLVLVVRSQSRSRADDAGDTVLE